MDRKIKDINSLSQAGVTLIGKMVKYKLTNYLYQEIATYVVFTNALLASELVMQKGA